MQALYLQKQIRGKMKNILSFIVLLVFNISTFSQNDISSRFKWEQGKLSWDEFKGIPIENSNDISSLSYTIGYNTFEKKIDAVNVKWIEAYSYIDKYSSWIKKGYQNKYLLLYNQTIFDIVELYSRKLQLEINNSSNLPNSMYQQLNNLLRDFNSQCKERLSFYSYQTDYVRDTITTKQWAISIAHELENTPRKLLPNYDVSKIGYGFSFDLGYGFLTSPANESFNNYFNFSFGFDFEYFPYILYLRGILGFSETKKEIDNQDIFWTKGNTTGIALMDLSLGYSIFKNSKLKITPFLGYGIIEFSNHNRNDEDESETILDNNFSLGINFDYFFYKNLNLVDYSWIREKSAWILRSRITAMPFDKGKGIDGWSINITFGIGGFGNLINM